MPKLIIEKLLKILRNEKRSDVIDIYTDGSHKGKWGSWAFVIVQNSVVIKESSGRERKTNSHRMEFQAAIEALQYLKPGSKANLHSDSRELIKTAESNTKTNRLNSDQIEILRTLILKHKISWKWVKAHSGKAFNERCDELCVQARSIFP